MEHTSIAAKVSAGATTGNVVVYCERPWRVTARHFRFFQGSAVFRLLRRGRHNGDDAGTNFGRNARQQHVTFNGTAATIVTWSNTSIARRFPMGQRQAML